MKTKMGSPDAVTTSACVADDDSSSGNEFEVFLSFRGPDTRLNFTDCLYHILAGAGIRVFRDNEEIRKGERIEGELLHAIETSKIYLPIFSKNYASSTWCLRELTHMLECLSRANDKVILPIFYDVNTDDVKLRTRLFLDDLDKHEREGHFDVQQWKKALTEVAGIKGWDLQDKGYGEICTNVADVVSTKLKKRRRNLPDHLVGFHDHVQAISNFLNEGSRDVRYLVIHGMGGIGKTTLASVVFNHIFNQFQGCSFLLDVRESMQNGRIIDLQKKLLSELCQGRSLEIYDSVDVGINIIRERFRDKKVLLVLDDVDKWDQLSKLAGKSNWFGVGSKIIITTRDINFCPINEEDVESCFQAHFGEFKVYQMTEMDSSHALKLFSKHAFKMDFPPHDFNEISRKITSKTGGLPLALEVIGSSLYCRSIKFWKDTLKKLDLVPKQEVLDRLKISYDMLQHHQREIFLDIACFFIGKERLDPYYMWKASNYFPKSEVLVLARMSLIKIAENDTLWMHDQLRDLAREIVRREDNNFPGKHSRLWEPKIAFNVVRMKEGTEKVVALRLKGFSKEHNFTNEEFSKLPNLRFLELEGGNLVGNFKNLLSKLTWLSWSDCPSDLSATNLCLEKLVVLELSGSNITEDWDGWGPCLVSENLKVIRITQCPSLRRTPNFSNCLNLKRLVFQGCTTLLVVDGSHAKLGDLKLTNSVGGLESLLQLDLSRMGITELPTSNENLKRLEGLCLDERELREPSKAIGILENKELGAELWGDLEEEIPSEVKVYSYFYLSCKLPTTKYGLSHLQQLRLDECGGIDRFTKLPFGLKELTLSSHILWTELDLSYLSNLVNLQIRRNTFRPLILRQEAPNIKWIEGLSNLERLTIDMGDVQCPQINWATLSRLQSSVIIHWHNVVCIRGVVRDSELVERLSVSRLKGLHQLRVFVFPGLMETQGVEKLKSLEALLIHRCSSLEVLPDLSKLKKLRQVNLAHCPLQNMPDLHLPDTCHLMVEGCGVSPAFDGDYKEWKVTQS